jgi:hypothetical protein
MKIVKRAKVVLFERYFAIPIGPTHRAPARLKFSLATVIGNVKEI